MDELQNFFVENLKYYGNLFFKIALLFEQFAYVILYRIYRFILPVGLTAKLYYTFMKVYNKIYISRISLICRAKIKKKKIIANLRLFRKRLLRLKEKR